MPVDGQDIKVNLERARELLIGVEGVSSATIVDEEDLERLLQPWLGKTHILKEIPVPQLVIVRIDEGNPPDLEGLTELLKKSVPGARLDTHRKWVERLSSMATTLIWFGISIFLLVLLATVFIVIFSTRGAMMGNKYIVDVLHYVGAENSYISRLFEYHFLKIGIKGAVFGGGSAILVFFLIGLWKSSNITLVTSDQTSLLLGSAALDIWGFVSIFFVAFFIALLTSFTTGVTVRNYLQSVSVSFKSINE